MRPHGRATIDPKRPRALGICDRCGFLYNHDQLQWQFQYGAMQLINLRILVCQTCLDKPQIQLRTILLPPDPVPIEYPRPENYIAADNPLSPNAAPPIPSLQPFSAQIGTMKNAGSIGAAFDGVLNKPSAFSAQILTQDSSYGNYVGINWSGYPRGTLPSNLDYPALSHTLGSYKLVAPNDSGFGFGSSHYLIQGSNTGSSLFSNWLTLASGDTVGTPGETISGSVAATASFQFHRVAFAYAGTRSVLTTSSGSILTTSAGNPLYSSGVDFIGLAQAQFFVTDGSSTGIPS